MYQQGHLPVKALLSERLPLSEVNEGFDRLARGESIRQVLVM
jgi:alcohol dehydrogenase